MSNPKLFNSKTKPIPRIRTDLDIIPVQNNGDSYLYFHDIRGYAAPDFALKRAAERVLSLLDGQHSVRDLKPQLGNGITTDQLLQFIRLLDENRVLHSSHFQFFSEQLESRYEQAAVHQSVTAGNSYPADPTALKSKLDAAFANHPPAKTTAPSSIKALYAPHIDPRVGMQSYVEAFSCLKNMRPKRVVILATSHYAGLYPDVYQNKPFIISRKDFAMPFGTIGADREAIDLLLEDAANAGLSVQDRAHRMEHSVELHLLFLSHLWQHNFSIVPIIVSGFDELFYAKNSYLGRQINNFAALLKNQFSADNETLFLISGDLAHTGKKFGDPQPASFIKEQVKEFDQQFLAAGKKGSTEAMLRLMKRDYDPYNICGFPPLFTFLKAFPGIKGQQISYDRWDETERESAVTFGSILYQ